ncbi:type IV secretory system conjugative DNA transfer family protein [Bacillus amyloliquefaciens]|uniref:type IV secretory system conjugative DNA transfer family protein n=1 Tax=Bacillus amyloliquefaciens TaxID=1390 RepID=UPI002806B362|nr:type IV secretory system conjugative DNA transfer family protein [Bacillus amyloliquefaciens]MDQ8094890.1 type IV secretory system conjugative DNA transfer family protein [Bacillus amyloliquefaciens]
MDKKKETLLDDFFDFMNERPFQRWIGLILLVAVALFVWRPDVILSILPYSESQIFSFLNLLRRFIIIGGIGCIILYILRNILITLHVQKHHRYLQILPHAGDAPNKDDLLNYIRVIHSSKRTPLERLFKGREWGVFMIFRLGSQADTPNKYTFFIGGSDDYLASLRSSIKAAYPRTRFFEIDDVEFPGQKAVGGRLSLKHKSLKRPLPLKRFTSDKLAPVLNAMEPGTWLQVAFSANDGWKLRRAINAHEKELKNEPVNNRNLTEQEQLSGLKHRFSGNEVAFDVAISFASEQYPGVNVIKNVAHNISAQMNDVNQLKFKKYRKAVEWYPNNKRHRMTLTGSELLNIMHFPNFKSESMNLLADKISHERPGNELLPDGVFDNPDDIKIGYQFHDFVKDREVRIPLSSLAKHYLSTGLNGQGKSSIVNMILTSLMHNSVANSEKKSPGFSFIDPAQQTILTLLNRFMKLESDGYEVDWNKVRWIQFKDTDHPPAMNLLYKLPGETNENVTSSITTIIRENFTVAPQTERLLRNCILTLLTDPKETHTILGVKGLVNDFTFRERVLNRIKNLPEAYDLMDFWNNEAPDLIEKSKIPLFNRLDEFLGDPLFRRMFGQKEFNFPVRKWMDEGYFILYDFSGLDDQKTSFLAGYLCELYYRTAEPRDENIDLRHNLVVDEAQRVKVSALPKIIRESRKKGLCLGILTQSLDSLGTEFQKTLMGAQGNFFVLRQGKDGARDAAEMFKRKVNGKDVATYTEGFLRTLPTLVAAVRNEHNKEVVQTLVKSEPLDIYFPDGTLAVHDTPAKDEAIKITRQKAKELSARNGMHEKDVDLLINAYLRGEIFTPQKEREKAEQKAPLTNQPKTPLSLRKKERVSEPINLEKDQLVEKNVQAEQRKTESFFSFVRTPGFEESVDEKIEEEPTKQKAPTSFFERALQEKNKESR